MTMELDSLIDSDDLLQQAFDALFGRDNEANGEFGTGITNVSSDDKHWACLDDPKLALSPAGPDATMPAPFHTLSLLLLPSTQRPPATVTRKRNKRRIEIEQLRFQVQELEAKMQALRECRSMKGPVTTDPLTGVGWRTAALRERARHERSDAEHHQLKTLVKEQLRTIRLLKRHISNRTKTMERDMEWMLRPSRSCTIEMTPAIREPALFAHLVASLDALRGHAASVCSFQHGFPSSDRAIDTELENDGSICVRVVETRTLPFPFDTVVDAVSRQSFRPDGIKAVHWETIEDSTHQGLLNTYADLGVYTGNLQGKLAMRRFDTTDRVTIVRSGWFVCSDLPIDVHGIRNYQWTVVAKPPEDAISVCHIVQYDIAYRKITLPEAESSSAQEEQLRSHLESFVNVSKHRIDAAQAAVDKILLPGH